MNVEQFIINVQHILTLYTNSGEQEKLYYNLREKYNTLPKSEPERHILFYILNQTCYNGLYRINKEGKFNVPVGRKSSGSNYQLSDDKITNFRQLSTILRTYNIHWSGCDYSEVCQVQSGDFLYLDHLMFQLKKHPLLNMPVNLTMIDISDGVI